MSTTVTSRRPAVVLALILVFAVLLRVGAAFYLGNSIAEIRGGTYDQISYDALAQRVVAGHGFSFATDWWPNARADEQTAFWSYPYTLYLAAVYAVAGHAPLAARLVQAVLVGALMPWLIYRIGRRAFDARTGLTAAAITAVYPYFVEYAASLMTESFYILGILWTLDAAMRLAETGLTVATSARRNVGTPGRKVVWGAIELGVAMAFTLLMRQVISGFLVVLVVWLLWVEVRTFKRWSVETFAPRNVRRLLPLVIAGGTALVCILPTVARNYRVFGQLSMPTTNAGFAFFWANHPIYGTRFEAVLSPSHEVTYQELIPPELRGLSEPMLDRALLVRGLQFIRDDPARYLLLSLSRIPVYFQFWPTGESTVVSNAARLLSFGLFLPFMLYGVVLSLRGLRNGGNRDGSAAAPDGDGSLHTEYVALLLSFVAVYTAIHLASWANVRYRLPVDAVLVVFAGEGIADLAERIAATGQRVVGPVSL